MRTSIAACISFISFLVASSVLAQEVQITPDENTQRIARTLNVKQVKEIRLNLYLDPLPEHHRNLTITNPQQIQALIDGLKTAIETGVTNQTSQLEVIDKTGRSVLYVNFALDDAEQALSPQFIVGLRKAGVKVMPWEPEQQKRQRQQQAFKSQLRTVAVPLGLALLASLFVLRFNARKRRRI